MFFLMRVPASLKDCIVILDQFCLRRLSRGQDGRRDDGIGKRLVGWCLVFFLWVGIIIPLGLQ